MSDDQPPELESMTEEKEAPPMFIQLSGDATEATEIESLCMDCGKNGITRLLMTRIPYFRDVILMAFHCVHCGTRNHELKNSSIEAKGVRYELNVSAESKKTEDDADNSDTTTKTKKVYGSEESETTSSSSSLSTSSDSVAEEITTMHRTDTSVFHTDMNRQIIKADSATIMIPELNFEIPGFTQPGEITTVEGIISTAIANLQLTYALYLAQDPENAVKLKEFMDNMQGLLDGEADFTIVLDDPAGNSFMQNPYAPNLVDPRVKVTHYKRSTEMDERLGYQSHQDEEDQEAQMLEQVTGSKNAGESLISGEDAEAFVLKYSELASEFIGSSSSKEDGELDLDGNDDDEDAEGVNVARQDRVLSFPGTCMMCHQPGDTRMLVTEIPHFKEIVVMSFHCDSCGFKDNDIKAAGAISSAGRKITFKITDPEDMSRDVLKAETAEVTIPELDLVLTHGTLGGRFTTIEGLLAQIEDHLACVNPFGWGDSAENDERQKFMDFLDKLKVLIVGDTPFTLVIDDPMANSYLQNIYAPDDDPEMIIEEYERTYEQNEMWGLNDIDC